MKKEFDLSKHIFYLGGHKTGGSVSVIYIKEFIKRNIGCGIDIGGWNCGDYLEQDLGKTYYCDRCKKLINEAGEKLK